MTVKSKGVSNQLQLDFLVNTLFRITKQIKSSIYWFFPREMHYWMVNSLHKLPVMQKAAPYHDVITWPNAYIRSSTMGMGSSIRNVCGSTTTGFHRCHLKVSLVPEPQGNAAIMERVTTVRWKYHTRCQAGNCMVHCHVSRLAETHFEGILPKGPYLPCVNKAGRALWQDTIDLKIKWRDFLAVLYPGGRNRFGIHVYN